MGKQFSEIKSSKAVTSLKTGGFSVEEHTCSECLQYQIVTKDIPICKKKLMTVTGNLHVTYEKKKGTCFEPKNK